MKKNIIITLCLTSLTLAAGFILSSINVSADTSNTTNASVTVPVACSLSATVDTAHTATINNGTYTEDIGTTTLTTVCNDAEGFAIYAIGYTDDTYGNNTLIGANTNQTITTSTATSGNISNWAMKLTKITDSSASYTPANLTIENSFDSYHAVPNEYTKVASYSSSTDVTLGSKLTTTYAAYISGTQVADTYEGQVKYTLVHPASGVTPTIPVTCNPSGTTISTIICMQDVSPTNVSSILDSMTTDAEYQLYDSRDEKQYYVAKLQDGNLWMTQNLDLYIDSNTTYTNEDTDIGWDSATNTYGTATWAPNKTTYTNSTDWTWYDYYPESYDPGDLYWIGVILNNQTSCEANGGIWSDRYSTCNDPVPTTSSGNAHYHLGNYYNWTAAVAMNDSSSYANGAIADQSICPTGWTLPRAGTGDDTFYSLWDTYGFSSTSFDDDGDYKYGDGEDALWTNPLYFNLGGYFDGGPVNIGYSGSYWSAVSLDTAGARLSWFAGEDYGNSWPNSEIYNRGDFGYQIRCIARPVTNALDID